MLLSCQQLPAVAQCCQSLQHPLDVVDVAELPAVAQCCQSLQHPLIDVAELPAVARWQPSVASILSMRHVTFTLRVPICAGFDCRVSEQICSRCIYLMATLKKLKRSVWGILTFMTLMLLSTYLNNLSVHGVEIPARHARYIRNLIQKFMETQGWSIL